jgi:endonuclease YncB( thermonuclease family)
MVRILLLGLAGAAAFAGVYAATAPRQPLMPALASADAALLAGTTQVRNVTPDLLTAPPVMLSPLVRVEPVDEPAPDEPRPARNQRLDRPLVEAAGLLRAGAKTVRIGGIEAPAADAVCGAEKTWPRGRMAKAALQRLLRGRSVECLIPAGAASLPEETDCAIGGTDLAQWLVAEGWAKPSGRFEAEGEKARRAGKGLWSETRPDAAPRTAQAAPASSPDSAIDMSLRVSAMP